MLFTLGMLEQYAGSVPRSVEHLTDASSLLDGPELVRALTELAPARFRLNDVAGLVECGERIDAVADHDDPEQQLLAHFTGGVALVLTGEFDAGVRRLAEVRRLGDLPSLRHDARALLLMALAAAFTGQIDDAVTVGAARLEELRGRGAIGVLVPLLAMRAAGRAWLGDHAGAFADAGEAAELAAHLGYAADGSVAVEMLAWQLAARGLHEEARESLIRARILTDRAGTTSAAAHQALTSAFCALCRGDLAEVVSLLEHRLTVDGGVGASGEPLGIAPLLVEAYIGLGRWADARSLTARYAEATAAAAHPLSIALLRRCQAVTADGESGAAGRHSRRRWRRMPQRPTRSRQRGLGLLYGGRLRRAGQRVAARVAARRGTRRVRRDGAHPLVHGRGGRAGRDRGHRPTPGARRRRSADLTGDASRATGGARHFEPGDRRRAVSEPENRRAAPEQRVPKARVPVAHTNSLRRWRDHPDDRTTSAALAVSRPHNAGYRG